jgi:hypothetical protein
MDNTFNLFTISFQSLNLLSFMLGMTWSFFNQGLFGRRIGLWVIVYFASLAIWYGAKYYMLTNGIIQ